MAPRFRGSPPRARGRLVVDRQERHPHRLTPACAGTTAAMVLSLSEDGAHPRVRGDDAALTGRLSWREGSPPRARGRHDLGADVRRRDGLTPACAGTTSRHRRHRSGTGAHPRVRGDDSRSTRLPPWPPGSPPRARGRPPLRRGTGRTPGLTPACAGTTVTGAPGVGPSGAHPRVRGDDADADPLAGAVQGSPPRARGRHRPRWPRRRVPGLTPACAGTTAAHRLLLWSWQAHPRVRGDDAALRGAGIIA